MKYDKHTRRQFLVGASKTLLALPFLPSVMPRETWAATMAAGPKFIGIHGYNGQWKSNFLPSSSFTQNLQLRTTQGVAGGSMSVWGRKLSEIAGDISPVLRSFNAHKNSMNILYNLSVPGGAHNVSTTLTGSTHIGYDPGSNAIFQNSIDQILARSASVYPNGIPARNLASLVVADRYRSNPNHSWYQGQGTPASQTTRALWDNILKSPFAKAAGTTTTVISGVKDSRIRALNAVFSDYLNVSSPVRNISSVDKQRLDSYMTLLNDVAKELDKAEAAPPPMKITCSQPDISDIGASLSNNRVEWDINYKLVAAAFQCGISSVAATRIRAGSDTDTGDAFHDASHLKPQEGGPEKTLPYQQWVSARIKVLIDQLASLVDVDGQPLLNNSLVLWGNELGFDSYIGAPGGRDHNCEDLPIVTFGGLGGKLRTGEMLHFRSSLGEGFRFSLNSVLETIMRASGVNNYPTAPMRNRNGTTISGFGMQGEDYRLVHYVNGPLPYLYVG